MTTSITSHDISQDTHPQVMSAQVIHRSRQWSLIWLIPMIALIVALYVGYQAWQAQGEVIEISFTTATGIESGKTKLRYKDVDVGKVIDVKLTPDLKQVKVFIAIQRDLASQFKTDAQFWVVRPRITTRTISGLSTLLSGAYITLTTGEAEATANTFVGLDEPPTLSGASEGKHFTLVAERLGSMDVGSPVFYRGIAVGEVVNYTLNAQDLMQIQIFIKAPYHRLVKAQTRFWKVNGIDISLGSDGVKAQMESLLSFMQGGLAFENIQQLDTQANINASHQFNLYPNKDSISHNAPNLRLTYVMNFSGSLAGLNEGAQVQHQGLTIGRVLDISPKFNHETLTIEMPVLVELWPERMAMTEDAEQAKALLWQMVHRGLKAQIKPANLLTGQMLIDLAYHHVSADAPPIQQTKAGHDLFPTVASDVEHITQRVNAMLQQLEKAPIVETIADLKSAATGLKYALDSKRHDSIVKQSEHLLKQVNSGLSKHEQLPAQLTATLAQTQKTLNTLDVSLQQMNQTLSHDSLIQHDFRSVLQELAKAATAIESLADSLQRQPNAVIFGKE